MACAWRERGNGQDCPRSSKVLSSMATTSSPGADTAPRRSKRWLTESCSRPGSRRANSAAPPAPTATRAATTATTARPETGLRLRAAIAQPTRRARWRWPARTTTVRPVCRSRTATLPLVTRVSVPSQRSETNQVVPRTVMTLLLARVRKWPWLSWPHSERGGRRRADRGGARAAGRARGQRPAQHELGHAVAAGGLAHLEAAAVEGAGLGAGAGQRALQLHGPGARVDDRADRHRGAVAERRRVGRPRHAHEDRAAGGREGHAAPEHRRGGGRGSELGPGQRRRRGGSGQRRRAGLAGGGRGEGHVGAMR